MRLTAPVLALALLAAGLAPRVARADVVRQETVIVMPPVGVGEAALASCAGGAAIGFLLVVASGVGSPAGTAALFCGLSAAATVTSSVTFWTWRTVTGVFR
ncbi:MAG: hypothetical protein AB7F35_23990 [Acetobacteraceae bacterium]